MIPSRSSGGAEIWPTPIHSTVDNTIDNTIRSTVDTADTRAVGGGRDAAHGGVERT